MDGGVIIQKVAVMSLSGGMDSTGLLLNLLTDGYSVQAISFDYGQKHKIEIEKAQKNISYLSKKGYFVEHNIIDLTTMGKLLESSLTDNSKEVPEGHYEEEQMKSTVVPNRNSIFSSIIYACALSKAIRLDSDVKIALGVHSGDHAIYPDCRPEFYFAIANAFSIGNWESEKVSFYLPYLEFDKSYILEDALTSAKKLNLIVAHVESGLRSFDVRMPEEQNRIFSDYLSDYLVCPNKEAYNNIKIYKEIIFFI